MTHPINCERFEEQLADLLERDVDEGTRASLEAHAISCGSCGPLLADLRKLRMDAANLPELAPSRELWNGIADRITTPVIELGHAGRVPRSGMRRISRNVWSGLAAAGLVVATAGITHVLTKRAFTNDPQPKPAATVATVDTTKRAKPESTIVTPAKTVAAATPIDTVTPAPAASGAMTQVNNPATAATATYDREIARLRAVLNQRRGQLDPQTVGVIELNLRVIDDAIAQCKAALRKDPASQFLMQSLNDELENKIELLRRAALLPIRSS